MENKAQPNGSATIKLGDKEVTLPFLKGTVGPDVVDIRKLYSELDIFTYDPGFTSTGSCESQITYIDGDKGVLLYRGYPIEQLAEGSSFLEVCYLLLHGELPAPTSFRTSRRPSPCTPWCMTSLIASSRASAATPTRWRSWSERSARCRLLPRLHQHP